MNNLISRFETKEPHYPNNYRELIDKLSRKKEVSTSEMSDEEQFERGKAFGTYYECYMYAVILGIRCKNQLPFDRGQGTKFLNIGSWKPKPIVQYIYMALLALAPFEFEEIETLTDDQANEKANELLHIMEGYAKGGFEIIERKMQEDPTYFEDTLNVVGFLKEIVSLNV
jgi:dnd system-associated protein 4